MSENPEGLIPSRRGKPWSEEEDRQLYASFVAGKPFDLILAAHERAKGGVTSRLKLLGLIDRNGEIIDPPPPFTIPERRRATPAEVPAPAKSVSALDLAFAVTTVDGWQVEIRSNKLLDQPLMERLNLMLQGAVGGL